MSRLIRRCRLGEACCQTATDVDPVCCRHATRHHSPTAESLCLAVAGSVGGTGSANLSYGETGSATCRTAGQVRRSVVRWDPPCRGGARARKTAFMFARLGRVVARHPWKVILGWLLLAVALRSRCSSLGRRHLRRRLGVLAKHAAERSGTATARSGVPRESGSQSNRHRGRSRRPSIRRRGPPRRR